MAYHDRSYYELEYPMPALALGGRDGQHAEYDYDASSLFKTTLIIALDGYADAGQAVEMAAKHLLSALDHDLVASFNVDELIDYRSRRPAMCIDSQQVGEFEDLSLTLEVCQDCRGQRLFLLSGAEPDLRWKGFSRAVVDLIHRFNISQTMALYSAPMPVPHTREVLVSAHGARPLTESLYTVDASLIVPGSASLEIERILTEQEQPVAGYTAHVPPYISVSPYPAAALALLETVEEKSGLRLPLQALRLDADNVEKDLAQQTSSSSEVQQVVHKLEQQYDEQLARYREQNPQGLLPRDVSIPSSDELGQQFEAFLSAIDTHDTPDDSGDPPPNDDR